MESTQTCLFDLSDGLVARISLFIHRSEHFKTLVALCKDGNRIFNANDLLSVSTDKTMNYKWDLFAMDCQYWSENEHWLLTDERKTVVLNEDAILYNRESATMVAYFLSNYSRILRLEKRYRRAMDLKNNYCVFPSILSKIRITPSINDDQSLSPNFADWFGVNVLQRCDARSQFNCIDMSNARLDDDALIIICAAIIRRDFLLNVSHLTVSNNADITDASMNFLFAAVGTKCPKIKTIDISGCRITDPTVDIALEFYSEYCDLSKPAYLPNIEWHNTYITPATINQFVEQMNSDHRQLVAVRFNTADIQL